MPNSLLWIGLVAVWLFVLVPMLVTKRPRIRQTTDAALATRVLHRGDDDPITPRGPAAGHRSDPNWRPSRDRRRAPVAADRVDRPAEDNMDTQEFVDLDERPPEADPRRAPAREFVPERRGRGGFDPHADAVGDPDRRARAHPVARPVVAVRAGSGRPGRLSVLSAQTGATRAGDPAPADGPARPVAARRRITQRRGTTPDPRAAAASRCGRPRGRRRGSGVRPPRPSGQPRRRIRGRRTPRVAGNARLRGAARVRGVNLHDPPRAADFVHGQSVCYSLRAVPRGADWGCGAVGSALRSHRRGQGFDSPQLHQKKGTVLACCSARCWPRRYRNGTRTGGKPVRNREDCVAWNTG